MTGLSAALSAVDTVLSLIRLALLIIAVLLAIFCLVDWLVRTRRVNVFGSLARFARAKIDPVLTPIERRVVAAGGNPVSAPLWALAAVVVGGILVISLLDFIRSEIFSLIYAVQGGAGGIFRLLVAWIFDFARIALLVRVISSWLPVSPYSKWIHWSYVVTEPLLRPLRQIIPTLGMIDITPIVAYFLIGLVQRVVMGIL
jgi:YggT family protein